MITRRDPSAASQSAGLSWLITSPLKEQKMRVAYVFTALLLIAISQAGFLFLVGPFLKVMFSDNFASGIVSFSKLFPKAVAHYFPLLEQLTVSVEQLIVWVPVLIGLTGILRCLAHYIYQVNQAAIAIYAATFYRENLFDRLLKLPYIKLKAKSAGEWMSLIMNDVLFLQNRFSDIISSLLKDTVMVVACIAAMIVIHWPTALFLIATAPFIGYNMGTVGKRIAKFARSWQHELGRIASWVLSLRERFDFMRSQSGEKSERLNFERLNKSYVIYLEGS